MKYFLVYKSAPFEDERRRMLMLWRKWCLIGFFGDKLFWLYGVNLAYGSIHNVEIRFKLTCDQHAFSMKLTSVA